MKPARIFIVRHGESAGNADKTVYETVPDWKLELTDLGRSQAHAAGVELRHKHNICPDAAVYVSPFKRTIQTFEGIRSAFERTKFNVKEDPRLREQEWGHLRCAEVTDDLDKERQAYGPFFYRLPDGESGADVYDRCSGFLETIHRDFKKETFPRDVIIVTHGFTMRVLLMRWFHWTVEDFHKLKNPPNCHIVEMRRNPVTDKYFITNPLEKKGA